MVPILPVAVFFVLSICVVVVVGTEVVVGVVVAVGVAVVVVAGSKRISIKTNYNLLTLKSQFLE